MPPNPDSPTLGNIQQPDSSPPLLPAAPPLVVGAPPPLERSTSPPVPQKASGSRHLIRLLLNFFLALFLADAAVSLADDLVTLLSGSHVLTALSGIMYFF